MLDKTVTSLLELPGPLLTAYLNTLPSDSSVQPLKGDVQVWFKKQAKALAKSVRENEREAFEKQVARTEQFLVDRKVEEKALVILAGPATWKVIPLHTAVDNELHWGEPALTQLLWLLNENKPHCVVAVDHKGARFFRYECGEMVQLAERRFKIDISQWKKKEMGKVAGQGVAKTRGSQRDDYQHRMDAQYKRLWRATAIRAKQLCEAAKLQTVFLVGSERMTIPIEAEFPKQLRERVIRINEDFGGLSLPELQHRLAPSITKWEAEHETALVANLLAEDRKAVVGLDETLTQLQKGKMRTVVVAHMMNEHLRECIECGWMDRSADPVCPNCGRERRPVELWDTLPALARSKHTRIEVVSGKAAEQLNQSGGIAGWLRDRTQMQLR